MKNNIIYKNGLFYTMLSEGDTVSAIEVRDGVIVNSGSDEEVLRHADPHTPVEDLGGKVILPGICDCHVHPVIYGSTFLGINCYGKTKEDILKEVSLMAQSLPKGKWIVGMGWNQDYWQDPSFPTRQELDIVSGDHPVKLTRYCGHAFWCNSKALKLAGLDGAFAPSLRDEGLLLDDTCHLAGVVYRDHCKMVDDAKSEYDIDDYKSMFLYMQNELIKNGITSAIDKGSGAEAPLSLNCGRKAITALKELCEEGKMKCRFYEEIIGTDEFLDDCYSRPPETDEYEGLFTMRGIKIWADGAMGARSAWLSEDYKDKKGFRGNRQYTDEQLIHMFRRADDHGYQIAVHAIGDATCTQVIDCYEKAFADNLYKDRRFIIDHFHIPSPRDIDRLVKYNMIMSTQFIQFSSDMQVLPHILPDDLLQRIYPWRQVLDKGGIVCNGSDVPIDFPPPFKAMHCAVTRKDLSGVNCIENPPLPALTRYEALKAFTVSAAYTMFEEKKKGAVAPGRYADFVMIDRDYFQCPTDEIKEIQVLKTYIGGEKVYDNSSEI